MSNQQTFDFLAGYCSQGKARANDLSVRECEQNSQSVPEPVKAFRAGTDWQSLGDHRFSPASVPASVPLELFSKFRIRFFLEFFIIFLEAVVCNVCDVCDVCIVVIVIAVSRLF